MILPLIQRSSKPPNSLNISANPLTAHIQKLTDTDPDSNTHSCAPVNCTIPMNKDFDEKAAGPNVETEQNLR
ncbi:hypothetical protein J4Q44_G00330410 [Coregonus suidteri]|uniref:Uncharacterized protein n=1 Tax=Coregonus suidteri TaxID=861788 RepID=A0AAN8Q9V1_9TELE